MPPFKIAVTGDTGYDLYSKIETGYVSQDGRIQLPEGAYDFDVPSGAKFLKLLLGPLVKGGASANDDISIHEILPSIVFDHYRKREIISTQPQFLLQLEESRSKDHKEKSGALRVKRITPVTRHTAIRTLIDPDAFHDVVNNDGQRISSGQIDLLVIHDGAGSWRNYPAAKPNIASQRPGLSAEEVVNDALARGPGFFPKVIVNIGYDLPQVVMDPATGRSEFAPELTLWKELAKHPQDVCLVCSANLLRRAGAAISRRLSWEQTIEDLATDLHLFEPLRVLSRFKHLIIRFGVVGAIHIIRSDRHRYADLVFAPTAKFGIYRDPTEEGRIVANNGLLIAALTRMIATKPVPPSGDQPIAAQRRLFVDALQTGLHGCMRSFDAGYHLESPSVDADQRFMLGEQVVAQLAESVKSIFHEPEKRGNLQTVGSAPVPCEILDRPPALVGHRSNWQILRDALSADSVRHAPHDASSGMTPNSPSRINLGLAIVLFGQKEVLNRPISASDAHDSGATRLAEILKHPECCVSPEEVSDFITLPLERLPAWPMTLINLTEQQLHRERRPLPTVYVPTQQFGKLTVVEREEIEGLSSIRNLMKSYLESQSKDRPASRPISVAVFGPPGSGKSFAVKQLASSINDSLRGKSKPFETIEYNVAQFHSVDDFGEAITRVSSINNEGKVPLVFFDEFDCIGDGKPLGWLKYFLAPMQDGTFYGRSQAIKTGSAVFIFAGGMYASFDDFDPSSDPVGVRREDRHFEELSQRRKDFKDQKGPDFISRLRGHINILPINARDGEIKPIIRRALVLRGLIEDRGLVLQQGAHSIAMIDEDVVYALLTVDRYRHGARSMEAILQMCMNMEGRILKASLPSRAQLHMHVNADEFMIRMARGRARRLRLALPKCVVITETVPAVVDGTRSEPDAPTEPAAKAAVVMPDATTILGSVAAEKGKPTVAPNQGKPDAASESEKPRSD